jgi:hypothetical protein
MADSETNRLGKHADIDDLRVLAAQHERDIATLTKDVEDMVHGLDGFRRDVEMRFNQIGERIQPKFGLMAQWTAVALVIVFGVSTPIAYHFNDKIQSQEQQMQRSVEVARENERQRELANTTNLNQLDERLQREFLLAQQTTREAADSLQEQMDRRLGVIEANHIRETDRFMQELQQRQMNDSTRSDRP